MSNRVISRYRGQAYQLALLPVLAIAVIALGLVFFVGIKAAYSAMLGAGIWLLPNWYFIYKFFGGKSGYSAKELAGRFYQAEVIKLLLSIILFIVVIKYVNVLALFVLGAYILAQFIYLILVLFTLGMKARY